MGIGLGIVLVVLGAILMWAVNINIPHVNDNTLGLILLIVGVLAIVISLIMNMQRSRTHTTHVEERRDR